MCLRGRDRIKGNVRYGEKRETNRSMTEREREGWGSLERKKRVSMVEKESVG